MADRASTEGASEGAARAAGVAALADDRSQRNAFSHLQLDRAAEHRSDAAWLDAQWPDARVIDVSFDGRARLNAAGGQLATDRGAALSASRPSHAAWMGVDLEGVAWFAQARPALDADAPGWLGLREAALQLSAFESGLFAFAKALLLWQTRARHCGACGHPTVLIQAGHAAKCANVACGLEHYPRTDAAVIVLITHADRALLGRQPGWPPKRYSTLAGFVEPGESLEDAVRREMAEEAGVRIARCHYHSSQPWPFPASLMIGFRAEAEHARLHLGEELEDARWFDAGQLLAAIEAREVLISPPISLSFRLIADWLLENAEPARVRKLLPGA